MRHISEVVLEGLSRVQQCSAVGRSAMASDVQDLGYSLADLVQPTSPETTAALDASMRLVVNYIKVCVRMHKAPYA